VGRTPRTSQQQRPHPPPPLPRRPAPAAPGPLLPLLLPPPPARRVHGRRWAPWQRGITLASRAGRAGPGVSVPSRAGGALGVAVLPRRDPRCPTTEAKGGSCQCSGWSSAPASRAGRGGGGAGACSVRVSGPPARRPPPTRVGRGLRRARREASNSTPQDRGVRCL
jgi:hypothetical protein